jgi:hypothetical protein
VENRKSEVGDGRRWQWEIGDERWEERGGEQESRIGDWRNGNGNSKWEVVIQSVLWVTKKDTDERLIYLFYKSACNFLSVGDSSDGY